LSIEDAEDMARRVGLTITLIVLASTLYLTMTIFPENVEANTLYVGGTGPGNYTSIQSAIENASIGGTVYVFNGTYFEHININKTLSLVGENKDTTNVDGDGNGDVINVTADWVNITGFTVTNSGSDADDAGIQLYHVQNCRVVNNTASWDRWGIYLDSSNNNLVSNNTALQNRRGIALSSSHNNTLVNNTLSPGNTEGIFLYDSTNNTILNNTFLENGYGIYFWSAQNNIVIRNDFLSHSAIGALLFNSDSNTIYHNNMIGNIVEAYDDSNTNQWDNGYPSGGNYWSNYTGLDSFSGPNQDQPGSDGKGDTAYIIDSDSQDWYPLMFPYGLQPPKPPTILYANLTGETTENVTLIWSLSPDDGTDFRSVVGYEIYRNSTYNPEGLGYKVIALVPNGTSEFVDVSAGEGNPNIYFYRVCALDMKNYSKCAEDQAGKFTRPLSEGPNLISIPLISSDESTEKVLQTVRFDKVWTYDSIAAKWNWHMTFKPYEGDLKTINHALGIWVNVTSDGNLTVAGLVPQSTSIHLNAGWNLVGFPSFNATSFAGDIKAETGATRMEGYDRLASPYFLKILSDGDKMQTGFGYWIRVESETTWTTSA
jgi:parallel beta-helix repeat protein